MTIKNKLKIALVCTVALVSVMPLNAQTSRQSAISELNADKLQQDTKSNPVTNMMYRSMVLNYSQELKQAKEGVKMAESGFKAVRSGMLPQLSGALDFNYIMKKIKFDLGGSSMAMNPYNYGATVTAAQNVFAGGVVRKQKDVAEIDQYIAQSSELMAVDNIIYNADYVYWSASSIAAYLTVSKEYLQVLLGTQALVQERYDSGLISKNDLLMIQTRVSEAQLNVSQMEANYKSAIIGLNVLMGVSPDASFNIAEAVLVKNVTLPTQIALDKVLEERPEYLVASDQLTKSKAELRVTKSDYLPQVAVGVTGQYSTPSINFDGKALLNGIAFASVKIPIYSGNARKHRVAIDNSKIRSNEYALQSTKDRIVMEVSTAWSNLSESKIQVGIAAQNLKNANESLELNSYSFSQGLLSILDLMQAQLSWFGAYNSTVLANYNYRIAYTEYMKSVGAYDRGIEYTKE